MPGSPTVCISVEDNDPYLSGDRGDKSKDSSGQTATIEVDGQSIDGVRFFAESYFCLVDQDGNYYYMIEMEVDRRDDSSDPDDLTNEDFFTFYGDVPPAGAELTVVSGGNVGCVDYKCLGAGVKWELDDECAYHIEAEDLELWGYKVEHNDDASGDQLIKLRTDTGAAKLNFGGEEGTYDFSITYVDEDDGVGKLKVFINGVLVEKIKLDQNPPNNDGYHDDLQFSTLTIEDYDFKPGDEIKLVGIKGGHEFVRIDKLTFTQVKDGPPVAVEDCFEVTEGSTLGLFSLLDNDTDPDGDDLFIITANGETVPDMGAVSIDVVSRGGREGEIAVLADGAVDLVFDQEDNFESLAEGETDIVDVTYTISDGNGIPAPRRRKSSSMARTTILLLLTTRSA